jgi:hypothetical protein
MSVRAKPHELLSQTRYEPGGADAAADRREAFAWGQISGTYLDRPRSLFRATLNG